MKALEILSPHGRLERLESPSQVPSWEEYWLGLQPPGRWNHFPEWEIWKATVADLMRDGRAKVWETWETYGKIPEWIHLPGLMPKGLDFPGVPKTLPYLDEHRIFVVGTRMGPILIEALPEALLTYLESPMALIPAYLVDMDGIHPLPLSTITLLGDSDPLHWRQARLWGWGALYHQRLYRLWTPDPCEP
jgi:hypothetical protein